MGNWVGRNVKEVVCSSEDDDIKSRIVIRQQSCSKIRVKVVMSKTQLKELMDQADTMRKRGDDDDDDRSSSSSSELGRLILQQYVDGRLHGCTVPARLGRLSSESGTGRTTTLGSIKEE